MSAKAVILSILLAAVLGGVGGWFSGGALTGTMRQVFTCMPLNEAVAMGVIDEVKRKALIKDLIADRKGKQPDDVAALRQARKGECAKFKGKTS